MKSGAPLKRYKALVAKTPMKRSASPLQVRGDSSALRKAKRDVRTRSKGLCELRIEGVCTGLHEETDHIKLRSRGRDDSVANLNASCRPCHAWKGRNVKEATEMGLTRTGAQKFGAYMLGAADE